MQLSEYRKKYPNIIFLMQYGFIPKYEISNGKQLCGICPFCFEDKFHVNPKTKMWDCKKGCCRSGGFKTFLKEVLAYSNNEEEVPELRRKRIQLAKNRGLSVQTLKKFNIGYMPAIDSFLIPVPTLEENEIWDIRIYDGKKLMSTSGNTVGLFGWHKLGRNGTVWLVEGEWDALTLWQCLQKEKRGNDIVIASPGAGTFKQEWCNYFKDRIVNVCYDNDTPGKKGAIKVYKKLINTVDAISFIQWNRRFKNGFDIRDYYLKVNKDSKRVLFGLTKMLHSLPSDFDEEESTEQLTDNRFDGEYIPVSEIYKTYDKWLYLPDKKVIDVLYGTAIANRLEGDPLWLFLVAPSGGTKTELLMSISKAPRTITTSTLTPQSLISGANFTGGGDPSLIPKLNNKLWILKDFTTILNMNQTSQEEIFGILRDAFDGKCEKVFGTGITKSYESKFGIVAGVTPIIEIFTSQQTAFGERFLRFNLLINGLKEKRKYLVAAQNNTNKEIDLRQELSDLGSRVLKYDFNKMPEIPEWFTNRLIDLAQWTSLIRGSIFRDKYTKDITHAPMQELGTRLIKQYKKLAIGISMFHNKDIVDEHVYDCILHVAKSTAPTALHTICKEMFKRNGAPLQINELVKICKTARMTIARQLQDLEKLDIIESVPTKIPNKSMYKLNDEVIEIINNTKIYTK